MTRLRSFLFVERGRKNSLETTWIKKSVKLIDFTPSQALKQCMLLTKIIIRLKWKSQLRIRYCIQIHCKVWKGSLWGTRKSFETLLVKSKDGREVEAACIRKCLQSRAQWTTQAFRGSTQRVVKEPTIVSEDTVRGKARIMSHKFEIKLDQIQS